MECPNAAKLSCIALEPLNIDWVEDLVWMDQTSDLKQLEVFALPTAFHNCSGPVMLTASTHLAMTCLNVYEQEFTRDFYYSWNLELTDS